MTLEITEETAAHLEDYARIPIAFEVSRVFDVTPRGDSPGGFVMSERRLDVPYVKDYDAIPGEGPSTWAIRFDMSHWGLLSARIEGRSVGGAVLAYDTPGLDMLEGLRDLALLWDIRVSPGTRGQGVGSALFRAAEGWASARGCRQLKVETQNINVPACRFYARQGCVLGTARPFAYPQFPDEIQLLWYKQLS